MKLVDRTKRTARARRAHRAYLRAQKDIRRAYWEAYAAHLAETMDEIVLHAFYAPGAQRIQYGRTSSP